MAPVWRHEMCGACALTMVIRNNIDLRHVHVNIKMDKTEIGSENVEWIKLIQERVYLTVYSEHNDWTFEVHKNVYFYL
jgi:hypothetical protein